LAVALLASLALGPVGVAAQTAQAQLEIRQFGWSSDGTLTPRGWNPVVVRVSGASDATARVQVTLKLSSGSANQTFVTPLAVYAQDVSLVSGAPRDVKLWLPLQMDGAYVVTAQLLGAGGQVLAEQSTNAPQAAQADGVPRIAAVADSPTLAAQLGKIEIPYQQGLTAQIRGVDLTPTDVPLLADYLAGFQAIVVQGGGAATLTAEQKHAIQQWVVQGGALLVIGGADASRAAAVLDRADTLGAQFGPLVGSTDLQPLADWAGADASVRLAGAAAQIQATNAELLAGSRQRPLAVRARWGDGSVTLLAVDPSLEPLRGWSGTPALLAHALQPALARGAPSVDSGRLAAGNRRPDDTRLLTAIDALPTNAFADWKQIALLLGGFAFLVGPVVHLVLWRLGRRPWLWVAVPALSLAVTAAIYVGAALQPGHDVVANVVSEVKVDPTTGDARQAMAVGFFAPLHDQLSVHIAGEVPVRVPFGQFGGSALSQASAFALGTFTTSARTGAALPGYRIITGRETQVDYLSNATLNDGLRSMVLSRGLPRGSFGQFDANLQITGLDGVVQGSVHNATPYAFEQVGLAVGSTIARIGPMVPGQTSTVSFEASAAPPQPPGYPAYAFSWQLFGVSSPTPNARPDVPSDPEIRRRLKIVDAVFSANETRPVASYNVPFGAPSTVRPMLVGISSDPIGQDMLPSAGAQRVFQETVVEVPVHLTIAPGPFTVTSWLLPATVGVGTGGSLNPGGTTSPAWLDLRGAATYTYQLDLPANSRVDRMNVTTQQAPGGSVPVGSGPSTVRSTTSAQTTTAPSTQGTFSIYNWQNAGWESLAAGSREVALSPAQEYVGPDGSVRIQVTSGGNDRVVRFLAPELTLEGQAGS
jgi:hypothetical protein